MMSAKVRRASRTTRPMVRATSIGLARAEGDEGHQQDHQQFEGSDTENVHGDATLPIPASTGVEFNDGWGQGMVQPGGTVMWARSGN